MSRLGGVLFAALALMLVVLCWLLASDYPIFANSSEGITEKMVVEPAGIPEREIRILFIGSSYMHYYSMPKTFVRIAQSDPQNHTKFVVQAVTQSGTGIDDSWNQGKAVQLIREGGWNYVILQDNATPAFQSDSYREERKNYYANFDAEIKRIGARTLLFSNWAFRQGDVIYQNASVPNPPTMLFRINLYMNELATRYIATAIPIGNAWQKALDERPGIELYMEDGQHPYAPGSYLTALVFYKFFANHPLTEVSYVPPLVSDEDAVYLRTIVSN